MTVEELIEELKKLPQGYKVVSDSYSGFVDIIRVVKNDELKEVSMKTE